VNDAVFVEKRLLVLHEAHVGQQELREGNLMEVNVGRGFSALNSTDEQRNIKDHNVIKGTVTACHKHEPSAIPDHRACTGKPGTNHLAGIHQCGY
jgi:hypothetical protein